MKLEKEDKKYLSKSFHLSGKLSWVGNYFTLLGSAFYNFYNYSTFTILDVINSFKLMSSTFLLIILSCVKHIVFKTWTKIENIQEE